MVGEVSEGRTGTGAHGFFPGGRGTDGGEPYSLGDSGLAFPNASRPPFPPFPPSAEDDDDDDDNDGDDGDDNVDDDACRCQWHGLRPL